MTLVELGTLGDVAKVTAEFVERFNNIFDCFNSSSVESPTPFKGAFQDPHIQFLRDCQEWLSSVQCASGNKDLPCLNGWRHNITALEMLWTDLKGKGKLFVRYIFLHIYLQDIYNNFHCKGNLTD